MKTVQSFIKAAFPSLFLVIIKITHCTNIFENLDVVGYCTDQRALCQNTGSFIHIVCEYYGKVGSACSKFQEVPLEDSDEVTILQRINSIRSQAAIGEAIGKDEQNLPRAYGMKKVFWDSELAAFAKIMIHQCINKHRYSCAASKTFKNPLMVYMSANTTGSAAEIIDNILSSWAADAFTTTTDEILNSPDLKGGESRYYIKMVVSDVTHIGCATGVYEHEIRPFAVKPSDNIRLSGHIICYFSHYSRPDTPVYNTTEPVQGTGWTKCGCPPLYRETQDCLCVYHKIEPKIKIPTNAVINLSTTTSSTTVYYNNIEKYMQQVYSMGPAEKIQMLDSATNQKMKMIKQPKQETPNENPEYIQQQKLEWSPKETLAPKMQQMLEPQIQQKLQSAQQEMGVGNPTPCTGGGRCEPKIIMLPILTIENAPNIFNRRKGREYRAYLRRSGSNSSVPTTKAIDVSFNVENIDELSQNMSMRSKVLEAMRKIRQNQAVDVFSKEKMEPMRIERSKDTEEPIKTTKRSVEPTKRTVESTKRTVKPHDRTTIKTVLDGPNENANKSVLNLLELLEEQGKIVEPLLSITEPSQPMTNKRSRDDGKEKAKRKVMRLLDLLERKGNQALLNSREFIDFDAKMRKIYKSVIKTPREGNLIKPRDTKPLYK